MFEFCRPCVDGILPMLGELKNEYLKRLVADREQRARKEAEL